ncbi:DUF4328 domain-containing protein, partial [Streptomyces sp. T-3]|nr:DUF4328 domain-containing protein [Streptomyces sp. T-3]
MPVLRSPVGLSYAVTALLGVLIALDLVSIWVGVRLSSVEQTYIDGAADSATDREADRLSELSLGVVNVYNLVSLATIVLFIVWFWRVRMNGEAFAPEYHAKHRLWTVFGWFVPIVSLWFPRRIAVDIWNASQDNSTKSRSTALLNWWWAVFLISTTASEIAERANESAWKDERYDAEWYKSTLDFMTAAEVLTVAAAVLAILFVRRLTRMQHEKAMRGPVDPP